MPNLAQTKRELLRYFALHKQQLINLFQKVGNITTREKIAEIEAIPGAVNFFTTIYNVLMDKSYWAQLFTTMHRTQRNLWVLETGMELIIQCAVLYFGYKKNLRETPEDTFANAHTINKSYSFHVTDYEWNNQAIPTKDWPNQLKTETFFGSHTINLFCGISEESLHQTKLNYESIFHSVIVTKNSSAIFDIGDGTYVAPVFIFNHNGKTTLLLAGNYTHAATRDLINKFKLNTIPSPNIPMLHNGDCSVYTRVNINLVAALARQEHSILQVLIKLSKNEINLKSHFLDYTDINLITQPQPSPLCIARMLAFVSTTLRNVGLEKGLVDYFREYEIDEENGLFSTRLINPKPLENTADIEQGVIVKFEELKRHIQDDLNTTTITLRGDTELLAKKTGHWVSPGLRDTHQYCPNPYNESSDYFKCPAVPIIHPYNSSPSAWKQCISLMRHQDTNTPDGFRVQHFLSTQTLTENLYLDSRLLSELHCLNAEQIPESGLTMEAPETNILQYINRENGIILFNPETSEITPIPSLMLSHGEIWLIEGITRIKIEATSTVLNTLTTKCLEHDRNHPRPLNNMERRLLASVASLQIDTPTVRPHFALQPNNGEGCHYNNYVRLHLYQGNNKIYAGEQSVTVHDYSVSPSNQEIIELADLLKETVETKPHDDLFLTSYVVSNEEKLILITHHCLLTNEHMDSLKMALSGCFSLSYKEMPSFENPSYVLRRAMQSACYIRVNNEDPVIAGLYYFNSKKVSLEEKLIKLDLIPEQLQAYDSGDYSYILFPDDLAAIRKATGHVHPIQPVTIDMLKENDLLKAAINSFNENYHGSAFDLELDAEENRTYSRSPTAASAMSSKSSDYGDMGELSDEIQTALSAISHETMNKSTKQNDDIKCDALKANRGLTIHYNYANRYHFYKAQVTIGDNTLYGDTAKRAILEQFKLKLEAVTNHDTLDQLISTLMDSNEYKILKTSQGIVTDLSQFLPERFRLKTDSVKAFEAMCDDMRSHLTTSCTN